VNKRRKESLKNKAQDVVMIGISLIALAIISYDSYLQKRNRRNGF
jgi:hypothetical protein